MRASGTIIKCTTEESTVGKMAESTKGSIISIKNKALVFMFGSTVVVMKDIGLMVSNMAKANTSR